MTDKKQIRLDGETINILQAFQKYAKKHKYTNIHMTSKDEYIYFTVGKLTHRVINSHTYGEARTLIDVIIPVNIDISHLKNSLPSLTLLDGIVYLATYGYETSWSNEYLSHIKNDLDTSMPLFIDKDCVTIKDLELLYNFSGHYMKFDMVNHVTIDKDYMGSSDGGKMVCIKHTSTILKDQDYIIIPTADLKNIIDIFGKGLKSKTVFYSQIDGKNIFTDTNDVKYTFDNDTSIPYPNYSELVEPCKETKFREEVIEVGNLARAIKNLKPTDKDNALHIHNGFINTVVGVKTTAKLHSGENIPTHFINKDFLKLMMDVAKASGKDIMNLHYMNTDYLGLTERLQFKGLTTPIFQNSGLNYKAVYMPLNPDLFA
jgi:hypothetical protein